MTKGRILCVLTLALIFILTSCGSSNQPAVSTSTPTISGENIPVPLLMSTLPTNGTESPDDIVVTPGGNAYRANVHQQGVADMWPPIETVETGLASGSDEIFVRYRSHIKTGAGEIRNNLLNVRKNNGLFEDVNLNSIKLYTLGAPPSVKFLQSGAVGLPGTIAAVLVIEIPQNIKSGS